jgi:hypothetical protein
MQHIVYVMRDGRTDETHVIDHRLIDLMTRLRATLHTDEPLEVVCGYRSPETNEALRETTEGVAANSLHMIGEAVDLRVHGRGLAAVHRAALSLKAGGVGYYPRSNFVRCRAGAPLVVWRNLPTITLQGVESDKWPTPRLSKSSRSPAACAKPRSTPCCCMRRKRSPPPA